MISISLILGIIMFIALFCIVGCIVGWTMFLRGIFITIIVTGWITMAVLLILDGLLFF